MCICVYARIHVDEHIYVRMCVSTCMRLCVYAYRVLLLNHVTYKSPTVDISYINIPCNLQQCIHSLLR